MAHLLVGLLHNSNPYLYLTSYVYNKRNSINLFSIGKKFFNNFTIVIILYSILMTLLSSLGFYNNETLNKLIIIPIIGQMLHFFFFLQIWKFNIKNNRENVLKYLNGLLN